MFGQSKLLPQRGGQHQHFGVNIGALDTINFNPKLMELTIAPFLWPLVAEHGAHIPQTLFLVVQQAMFVTGTNCRGGTFRAQGETVTVAIGEGVHLLLDNICHFPYRTLEQVCVLNDRCADFTVTERGNRGAQYRLNFLPYGALGWQNVIHSANRLDLFCHYLDSFCSGAKNSKMPAIIGASPANVKLASAGQFTFTSSGIIRLL